jgi:hypothetical protein
MSWLFHDTFFALVVRAVLGPTYFPHLDETNPPNVYQKTVRRMKSSESTIGRGTSDHDNPQYTRGRGFGAFGEQEEVHATQSVALQSSLSLGPGVEDHDDPLNVRGRGFGAFGEHTTHSVALQSALTLGTGADDHDNPLHVRGAHATQSAAALQSSLSIVATKERLKPAKEEGTDSMLVTWNDPNDPEVCQDHLSLVSHSIIDSLSKNPMNWSHAKKTWVMFQVCLLTFSVYIGSAIYTAGIGDVIEEYHVSSVAATLGLSLFVAGYGLGALCIDV